MDPPPYPYIYEESQFHILTKSLMKDYEGDGRLLLICEPFLSKDDPSHRLKEFAKVIKQASEGKVKEVVFAQIKEMPDDLDEQIMRERLMQRVLIKS